MMTPLVSHLLTLLAGIFIGVVGQYFADRFTDQRRSQEQERKEKKRFAAAEALMPELIAEMREDLRTDPTGTKREFFPYDIGRIHAPGADKLFYEPKKHPDLRSKLTVLENHGYIVDVSISDTKRYRMTEHFVALLKNG
jgi:hypothetical protein